jgi:hypothetical protein
MANVTQVSWIDSDEVADLVRQLQGPAKVPDTGAWELHTQPLGVEPPSVPAFSLAPDPQAVEVAPAVHEAEVAPLAEEVPAAYEPPPAPPLSMPSAVVRTDPFGAEMEAPEIERIRQQLRELRQRAQNAGVMPAQEVASETPPPEPSVASGSPVVIQAAPMPTFVVPDGPLGGRLQAFHQWASGVFESADVLLLDSYGDVLEGNSPLVHLAMSSVMAWQTSQRMNPARAMEEGVGMERTLPDGRIMTVMPVQSDQGTVSLIVIAAGHIPDELRATACAALLAALHF